MGLGWTTDFESLSGARPVDAEGLGDRNAFIIYWNTRKLGEAVFTRKNAGLDVPAEFLAHVSPLGWEHINLTGEYRWPSAGPRST